MSAWLLFFGSAATLLGAVAGVWIEIRRARREVHQVRLSLNGRLDMVLKLMEEKGHAKGVRDQRDKENGRGESDR